MGVNVEGQINDLINKLISEQAEDGSWKYPFETGILTDCCMIILLRTLQLEEDEDLIKSLTRRILNEQYEDGAWRLFLDEERGNISLTVSSYYALQISGYVDRDNPKLLQAKKFIIENGGIDSVNMFTKVLLSLTGQKEWEVLFPIPVEAVLLPKSFPVNFFDISVFGRANIAPLLILADSKFVIKPLPSTNLNDLFIGESKNRLEEEMEENRSIIDFIEHGIKEIEEWHNDLHGKAIEYLEDYMNQHTEADGTLYSYFSATFYMIYAFLARGKSKNDPKIIKAISGLKSMICVINGNYHCQYTTANVWNTSLLSDAIQNAGVPTSHPTIIKATEYLLKRQHNKFGDWKIHSPGTLPGGWGFSNINTINPDIDDTSASLRSLSRLIHTQPIYQQSWNRGIQWILSMQNDDGGWASFERNVDNPLLNFLPYGEGLLMDASSTDLTGRTLEFLGIYTDIRKDHPQIKKAKKWLFARQNKEGSWDSRWGIYFIYGTWTAVLGLLAVNISSDHPAIVRAKNWLTRIQNDDGGWGESCRSDIAKKYVALNKSTLTHTAWALDALITISDKETPTIRKGINFLIKEADIKERDNAYPAGQGLGGQFYIHYHSYQYVWPLITLVKYNKKFKHE